MSFRSDLISRLKTNSVISTKVGNSIYAKKAPIDKPYPLIVFHLINGRPVSSKQSETTIDDLMVQVDVISNDLEEVEEISTAVITVLDYAQFGDCHLCRHQRTMDDMDEAADSYRIMNEFTMWQRRS